MTYKEKSIEEKLNNGLSLKEVRAKKQQGLFNKNLEVKTKTYWQIVSSNLFSLFNLINLILFICVLIAGSPKNGLFFLIVIWNFAIGVIQEIRAKKTIEKLSLLTSPKAFALREGTIIQIIPEDIVLGEILQLKNGNQVCVDCIVLEGQCLANESLVTGESEPVLKKAGDRLISGSFLVSGTVMCECEKVGAEIFVNKITAGAKYVKKSNSVILSSVKSVIKVVAIALIPLAGLMVWKNFFLIDHSFSQAMIATVASISAMIPGGLVLLVSLVMTVSVIKLSRKKTLAQDIYCIENLARVDVLCLDKTGTLTEGKLKVEEVIETEGYNREELLRFAEGISDENSTIEAIRDYLEISSERLMPAPSKKQIPFSSDRKWSLLEENEESFILGAPEIICKQLPESLKKCMDEAARDAKRVVAFAKSSQLPEGEENNPCLPKEVQLLCMIIISDSVRKNAREIMDYFEAENVCLKVISGDNPVTVSRVAMEAGLDGAEKYIDASKLDSYEKIEKAVQEYTVFGRVTPYQKLDIIKALKSQGHTVAMVGDGANDVLALKEADCSVAMQAGSDAARNVSSLVLLESDFAALPDVLAEGRKTINNLQRSAGLYLTKTTYAFILTIAFMFLTFAYPFQSIQVTLVGAVTIGIPSFLLAFEPNTSKIKEHFLKHVFMMCIPSGILMAVAILTSVFISRYILEATTGQIQTIATLTAVVAGIIVIINICGKMNKWKWIMVGLLALIAFGAITFFGTLFSIQPLNGRMWMTVAFCQVGFFILHTLLFRVIFPKLEKSNKK